MRYSSIRSQLRVVYKQTDQNIKAICRYMYDMIAIIGILLKHDLDLRDISHILQRISTSGNIGLRLERSPIAY